MSVCIPARNAARYLGAAIASVLAQTRGDFELIVADDASDDETAAVVAAIADARVRYVRNPAPLGIARNRDRCLALARGRYIAWLDADDVYHPHMLAVQCAVLDHRPDVGLVHGGFDVMSAEGRTLPAWPAPFDEDVIERGRNAFRELVLLNYIRTSTVVVRRAWHDRVGPHAAEIGRGSSDWEMWLRLALHTDMAFTARPVARYRVHPASISAAVDGAERLACDRAAIDRIFRLYRPLIPDAERLEERARAALAARALQVVADASSRGRVDEATAGVRFIRGVCPALGDREPVDALERCVVEDDEYGAHAAGLALMDELRDTLTGSRLARRLGPDQTTRAGWERVLRAIADTVQRLVPETDGVAVIDKADPTILALSRRRGWHFPDWRTAPPGYPPDDRAAIEQLDALQGRGARYLVVPGAASWWLEHYQGLTRHLEASAQRIWSDENCAIYRLAAEPYRTRTSGRSPSSAPGVSARRRPTIAIAGALAQKPWVAGHTWVFLQYLLGFKRLGFDVIFLDRLDPEMCVDADGRPCPPEQSANLRYLRHVADAFGFGDSFAVFSRGERQTIGVPRERVRERLRKSVALLNVMGYLADEDVLAAAPRRVFLDIDPSVGQMWRDLGLADVFRGHDRYVTIGEHIGRDDCGIPTCGLSWLTTRQPVVLDHWPATPAPADGAFTTVAAWRGTYGPIEYRGAVYGQRVHEFRRFAPVPRVTGRQFRMALDIDGSDERDLELLDTNGWTLVPPRAVAATPDSYCQFIQQSRAEFMVAKQIYVGTNSGWFSDRSICYLASGRPVLVQDTGLSDLYPLGLGLVTFSTLDEAVAGVEDIHARYTAHARAAREIAEAYFDSDKVLTRLLEMVQ